MIFIKKCGFYKKYEFFLFRLFRFLSFVMKINYLLQIGNIDIWCYYNFNKKTKYIWYQIFVVNLSDFWTEHWPNFSIHTATVNELVYKYIYILNAVFNNTCTKKNHLLEEVNNLWLISNILSNKCRFCVFSWFLSVTTTHFCQIPTTSCSEIQIVNNYFILHPKSITELVWFQIFVIKGWGAIYRNIGCYSEGTGILCIFVPWAWFFTSLKKFIFLLVSIICG